MLTEDLVKCPKCGGRCFTRYGSQGWWQFELCFDCEHYEQYDGDSEYTREETFVVLHEHHGTDTTASLYEKMVGEKW